MPDKNAEFDSYCGNFAVRPDAVGSRRLLTINQMVFVGSRMAVLAMLAISDLMSRLTFHGR